MTVETLQKMLEKYIEEQKNKTPKIYKGQQSLKHLAAGGNKLTNIEITGQNIKSFAKTARKYGVDFALRKDNSSEKPHYFVFFKAKDVDVLTAAFKEFCNKEAMPKKPKIHDKIRETMEKITERTRQKSKTREAEL